MHSIVQRFLADEIFQKAMEAVTTAKQSPGKIETQFYMNVIEATLVFRNIFYHVDLVNAYVEGLQACTCTSEKEHVRHFPSQERENVVRVLQGTLEEGKSQSVFIAEQKESLVQVHVDDPTRPIAEAPSTRTDLPSDQCVRSGIINSRPGSL